MKPDLGLVSAMTEAVLPVGTAVVATDPTTRPEAQVEAEARAVAHSVPARQIEFLAGRAAARSAMVALGLAPHPVPMGEDRAPIWPQGVIGSITHTEWACVAAVSHARDWAGIGIDLETADPLPAELIAEITTPVERSWLTTQPENERGLMARLMFSAKEAAYKAQYPVSRMRFGFPTFELRINRAASQFDAVFQSDQPPFRAGHVLGGKYLHAAGVLVTAVTLGHSDAPKSAGGGT